MAIQRMDHVGIVVDDLGAATAFFIELGMELVGEAPVEGPWVDRVNGLDGVRVEIAFLKTPDGHGQVELTKFHHPAASTAEPGAPPNTLGLRNIMFAVDDLEDVVTRLRAHDGELVGQIADYTGESAADGGQQSGYRLCYVRGPAGVIIALAQPLNGTNQAPVTTTG